MSKNIGQKKIGLYRPIKACYSNPAPFALKSTQVLEPDNDAGYYKTRFLGGLVWEQMGEPPKDWPYLAFLAFKDIIFSLSQILYYFELMVKIWYNSAGWFQRKLFSRPQIELKAAGLWRKLFKKYFQIPPWFYISFQKIPRKFLSETKRSNSWPLSGLFGLWKAVFGTFYSKYNPAKPLLLVWSLYMALSAN